MKSSASWFRQCGWGVFCHYLTDTETTAEEWNEQVNNFNVEGLARQLDGINAAYFFLTLGQGSGHYCAPNDTYDKLTGITLSKCSQRDLISDLADAFELYNIKLMVYVPADGSFRDDEARKGLKLTSHPLDDPNFDWGDKTVWAKYRLPEFQTNWENVCRDWSLRFGRKIHGWWVDGAYGPEYRYPEDQAPNYQTYAAALKAGNPEAIIAFNTGVDVKIQHVSEYEDYTAGEIAYALPTEPVAEVDYKGHKAQYHMLTFLGEFWCHEKPRFSRELCQAYTDHVISRGGVITWDVPILKDGLIPECYLKLLSQ